MKKILIGVLIILLCFLAYFAIFNGISFATWSGSYVDIGDDLDVGNSTITLQPFQFPKLYTNSLANKIKIVKKSVNNINRIQY